MVWRTASCRNIEMKQKTNNILTIPTILSLFRICLIPVCVWAFLVKENTYITVFILALSWITDIADGYIARRFNMISDLGKLIDPIADKLTQAVMLFCLILKFPYMLYLFILMVIKETLMAITGYIAIRKTKNVYGANWHGKIATGALYTVIIIHIVFPRIEIAISQLLTTLCALLMTISFILYLLHNIRIINEKPRN